MASNQKSLEEMLSSEVDESAITALVSQLERPMSQETSGGQSVNRLQSKAVLIDGLSVSGNAHNNPITNTNTTPTISANSVQTVHNNSNCLQTIINTNAINTTNTSVDNNNKMKIIVNNNNNTNNNNLVNINVNTNNNNLINSNNNNNNKLLSQTLSTTSAASLPGSLPGALPASGYLTQVNMITNI